MHPSDNILGVGPQAQGPHGRKNYISIERMSCCAEVIVPQSRYLWPLTSAKFCVCWNIDPLCSVSFCRIYKWDFENRKSCLQQQQKKSLPSLWFNHLTWVSISISAQDFRRRFGKSECARGHTLSVGFLSDMTKNTAVFLKIVMCFTNAIKYIFTVKI